MSFEVGTSYRESISSDRSSIDLDSVFQDNISKLSLIVKSTAKKVCRIFPNLLLLSLRGSRGCPTLSRSKRRRPSQRAYSSAPSVNG